MNRFSSARIAAVAAFALGAVPVAGMGNTAAATPTVGATAAGAPHCTEGESWKGGGWGQYADVWACMKTDGKTLNITAHAACYYALGTYERCSATGNWTLRKNGEAVVSGGEAPYPGPGTYELDMYIVAEGRSAGSSSPNLRVSGRHVRTVTFDTPFTNGPHLLGANGPSDSSKSTLTVMNKGDQTAKAVVVTLSSPQNAGGAAKLSDDRRCKLNHWGNTECALGDVAPNSSVSLPVSDDACRMSSEDGSRYWSYKAENFPEFHAPLCG
ncbi:hypothetical protein ACPCBC_29105 [Streptomyces incarnatus]|nr:MULTISPECIES: hypothetical protein [Streptomyces]